MDTIEKLAILADAAKYDASCASSGAESKDSRKTGGIGSTGGTGICHSYAPDGRCISLLKVLLTNLCVFDCHYCVNRSSSNVERARFTAREVVDLTMGFYRKNLIEGLFLSSGIIRNPDYTMEQVVEVARILREEERFSGYIHLKTIPDASPELLLKAGRYADRLSINVELPEEASLKRLAPEKDAGSIKRSMARLRIGIDEAREAKAEARKAGPNRVGMGIAPKRFAPAGQSTQMIVGADATDDSRILTTSSSLYSSYGLRRVYYSAFSPIPDASRVLPLSSPPLMREHRLYQADWLMRFYGFEAGEILQASPSGMLDLELDPKTAWALANRERFPVDVNTASREELLRVPGLGTTGTGKILASRRFHLLRLEHLTRLCQSVRKVLPFVVAADWTPGGMTDSERLRDTILARAVPKTSQLDLFAA